MTDMLTEDEEQMMLVSWFRKTYHPMHRIFAIPNGGVRSKLQGMKLKVTGVSAGVPDLFIPSIRMFIEMKRVKGGVVSEEQKDWINYLNSVGYSAIVCKGFEEAKNKILVALPPMIP